MHAIILAGGFGTRLREAVADVPKPLAPIAGRPFLSWLIDSLVTGGVTGITLSVHHEWEKIYDYFGQHPALVPINYAVEPSPLGTGGAIAYALTHCPTEEPVIVVNGDTFVQVDYRALYAQHKASNAKLTMVLRQLPDAGRYGNIETQNGIITSFQPGTPGKPGLINAGTYVMDHELFVPFNMPEAFSFEQDFMAHHVKALKPRSFMAGDYFIDIGIPADYARACKELPELCR